VCRRRGVDIARLALQFGVAVPHVATTVVGAADPDIVARTVRWAAEAVDQALLSEVEAVARAGPRHGLADRATGEQRLERSFGPSGVVLPAGGAVLLRTISSVASSRRRDRSWAPRASSSTIRAGRRAHVAERLPDRGQGRHQPGVERVVVEAHDAQVLRDPRPAWLAAW
jgi:thiazole synthase ThiGH ThiG subunit